jgi:hypothetical protein
MQDIHVRASYVSRIRFCVGVDVMARSFMDYRCKFEYRYRVRLYCQLNPFFSWSQVDEFDQNLVQAT